MKSNFVQEQELEQERRLALVEHMFVVVVHMLAASVATNLVVDKMMDS